MSLLSPALLRALAVVRRRRLPLALLLVFGLSALVASAVASVLYLAIWTGQQNTIDLARDRAELVIGLVAERIRQQLEPARNQARFLAEVIVKQGIDPTTDRRFVDLAGGALAATPQVTGIGFVTPDYRLVRVFRAPPGGIERSIATDDSPAFRKLVDDSRREPRPFWGDVVWSEGLGQPLVNLRAPVHDGERFLGILLVVLSVADLSAALGDVSETFGATAFILVDRDRVLAHPSLALGFLGRSPSHPLPRVDEVGDAILARIWEEGRWVDRARSRRILAGRGHIAEIDGATYLYIYQGTTAYGPRPWLVGTYQREETLSAALERTWHAVGAGVAILLIAATLALWIGRRLTGQIGAMAGAASRVQALDFDGARHVPSSRFRELDDAATAFNAMIDGLRWFESYVPKPLIRRLMGLGVASGIASVEREVSVMFTDIAGFTTLSETMGAAEVADLLNHHFTLVDACIDAEGGTVDKHLGDGVMAFWGAPELQDDHAMRACRAALAIAAAIAADNARRRAEGGAPIRVRIGIHRGPVTVGNVGGPSRLNYTIVGDTVNTANRLCELGRDLVVEREVVILVSGAIGRDVGSAFDLAPVGAHVLRGRHGGTEVWELMPPLPLRNGAERQQLG